MYQVKFKISRRIGKSKRTRRFRFTRNDFTDRIVELRILAKREKSEINE